MTVNSSIKDLIVVGAEVVEAGANATGEIAKAEQEFYKTVQKGMDLSESAAKGLSVIFRGALQEWGESLRDRMKRRRFENLASTFEILQRLIEEKGITSDQLKTLPFGDVLKATKEIAEEDDPSVRDLWARLLANSLDPAQNVRVEKLFIRLLSSLSSPQVMLLKILFDVHRKTWALGMSNKAIEDDIKALISGSWQNLPSDEQSVAAQDLIALRCVAIRPNPINADGVFSYLPDQRATFPHQKMAAVNPEKMAKILELLSSQMAEASGLTSPSLGKPVVLGGIRNVKVNVPELRYFLTPLGLALMKACNVP